jgi:hypothetical protein
VNSSIVCQHSINLIEKKNTKNGPADKHYSYKPHKLKRLSYFIHHYNWTLNVNSSILCNTRKSLINQEELMNAKKKVRSRGTRATHPDSRLPVVLFDALVERLQQRTRIQLRGSLGQSSHLGLLLRSLDSLHHRHGCPGRASLVAALLEDGIGGIRILFARTHHCATSVPCPRPRYSCPRCCSCCCVRRIPWPWRSEGGHGERRRRLSYK